MSPPPQGQTGYGRRAASYPAVVAKLGQGAGTPVPAAGLGWLKHLTGHPVYARARAYIGDVRR
ncbi:hypothetical protein AZA_02633 [Nitrospirillum viridazoti Y2]|nr:hypothetical protein AZA_02633 [Nitrospirillum amazonense Y2]